MTKHMKKLRRRMMLKVKKDKIARADGLMLALTSNCWTAHKTKVNFS